MEHYARVIQKLQNELGLPISSFSELNIFPLKGEGYSQDDITTYYDVDLYQNKTWKNGKKRLGIIQRFVKVSSRELL